MVTRNCGTLFGCLRRARFDVPHYFYMKLIPLTQGKFAQVDDEDFDWLSQWKWYAQKGGKTYYAVRCSRKCGVKEFVKMHRLILRLTDRKIKGDHEDLDGLNNQKTNLRPCTQSQNLMNRGAPRNSVSGIKGVYWCKKRNNWRAKVKKDQKSYYLGRFNCKDEAGKAYDRKAKELFGEFATLNFPDEH